MNSNNIKKSVEKKTKKNSTALAWTCINIHGQGMAGQGSGRWLWSSGCGGGSSGVRKAGSQPPSNISLYSCGCVSCKLPITVGGCSNNMVCSWGCVVGAKKSGCVSGALVSKGPIRSVVRLPCTKSKMSESKPGNWNWRLAESSSWGGRPACTQKHRSVAMSSRR